MDKTFLIDSGLTHTSCGAEARKKFSKTTILKGGAVAQQKSTSSSDVYIPTTEYKENYRWSAPASQVLGIAT